MPFSLLKNIQPEMINEVFRNQCAKYSHILLPLYKHTGQEGDSLSISFFFKKKGWILLPSKCITLEK